MDDLISRQAAIEALEKCHKQCCREDATGDEWIHYETTLNEVESIPPAPKNDADCISRQAAIDADGVSEILTRVIEEQKKSHHVDEVIGLMEAKTEVNNAPTLDVKPVVHAHWVPCEDEYEDEYKCSACGGTQFFAMTPQNEGWEYCPKCGAKMDEEENET